MWLPWFLLALAAAPFVCLWTYNFVRVKRMSDAALLHRGRPLLFDYFASYRAFVRELITRGI